MLESRWLECKRPAPMLRYLADRASPRKLRLFICGCCRRLGPWLRGEASRQTLVELERQADARRPRTPTRAVRNLAQQGTDAARERLRTAAVVRQEADQRRAGVWGSIWVGDPPPPSVLIRTAAEALAARAEEQDERIVLMAAELIVAIVEGEVSVALEAEQAASVVALGRLAAIMRARSVRWMHRADEEAERPVSRGKASLRAAQAAHWIELQEEALSEDDEQPEQRAARRERRSQCDLLRDLFGNPFRPMMVEPAWLDWNDGCVAKLARAIYEERKYQDMKILGDALEEAGCGNPDILAHCRQPGEHVRGCWVVDLLLGLK
jgi:hypothetical protein